MSRRHRFWGEGLLLASLVLVAGKAWAIADPRRAQNIPASLYQGVTQDPTLAGVFLFADHDPASKIVYVTPSNRRHQVAKYVIDPQITHCQDLKDQYAIVYRMPRQGTELQYAREGSYSPFFDLHYGNSVRMAEVLMALMKRIATAGSRSTDSNDITKIAYYLRTLDEITRSAFERQDITLQIYERVPVGAAEGSLTIWGDEVARVQSLAGSEYHVQKLPVTSVTLDIGDAPNQFNAADASGTELMQGTTTSSLTGLSFKALNPDSAEALSFVIPVSRGAYCMMDSKRASRGSTFVADSVEGTPVSFSGFMYKDRGDNKEISQTVLLKYNYLIKSEATVVHCEADSQRFFSRIIQRGSSGILFWRRHWEKEDRKLVEDHGISCHVTKRPQGLDPAAADRWADNMSQTMAQEIMAEMYLGAEIGQVSQVRIPAFHAGSPLVAAFPGARTSLCGDAVMCTLRNFFRPRPTSTRKIGRMSGVEYDLLQVGYSMIDFEFTL